MMKTTETILTPINKSDINQESNNDLAHIYTPNPIDEIDYYGYNK